MTSLKKAGLWLLLAAMTSASARAQSANDTSTDSGPVEAATGTDADNQDVPAPLWTLTSSAGVAARDDGPDGTWEALALTRQIGKGYARASVMRYHGTLLQADTALPSNYLVGTLAAGGNFDGWVTDGWISFGRQDYGQISTAIGSRASTGATGSAYFAVGGDFGKVIPLDRGWYLTSTITASYAYGKLLRPAPTGTNFTDLETKEPTWSASSAVRLDHAFGERDQHYAGLSISRNWTSNAVSAVRITHPLEGSEPRYLDSVHYPDGWFEAGATANMQLTPQLHLDLFATRGFGMRAGDTTSGGVSLRIDF